MDGHLESIIVRGTASARWPQLVEDRIYQTKDGHEFVFRTMADGPYGIAYGELDGETVYVPIAQLELKES